MSLSKPAVDFSIADDGGYLKPQSLFERLLAPWQELCQDVALECQAIGCRATDALGLDSDCECGEPLAIQKAANGSLLQRIKAPLEELAEEEVSPLVLAALVSATGPCAATALTASLPVWLCGLTVHTKGLYFMLAVGMFGGAYSMSCRHGTAEDRTLMQRSAAVVAVSGAAHLLLLAGGGLPEQVASYFAHPDVVARFLPDLFCTPVLIWNLGYIAGKRPQNMVPPTAFSLLSITSYIAAASVHDVHQAMWLLCSGSACMLKAAYDLNVPLPMEAGTIASCNRLRTQMSSDLMVLGWLGYPFMELLGLTGCISPAAELNSYVALDVITKLGVSHIILRSSDAFSLAARHFAQQRQEQP